MPSITIFFRHCPSCGRRFEIRLACKEPVSSEIVEEKEKRIRRYLSRRPLVGSADRPYDPRTMVQEDAPSTVDVEEFQYEYKCEHCGHEWSEVHETERKVKEPKGYTGD